MVTDYDCWHPHHDSVTVDQIIAVLVKNAENAAKVVRQTVADMPSSRAGNAAAFPGVRLALGIRATG